MIHNPTIVKYSEMIDRERAFVLEMIQKHKPKKICEIGIAAGANSAIILDHLSQNGLLDSVSLHAIDYNTTYYKDLNNPAYYQGLVSRKRGGGGNPSPVKAAS